MKEKKDPDIKDLVKSSLRDIEDFEKSLPWHDIKRILKDWSEGLKSDYDNAENMEEVRMFQGIAKCIDYVNNLPEAMKAIISLEVKDES